ncbi:response regulator [Flavobacterium sp.]|uniref:response regulator n=1 Tax=Flavobacterium sp. TaxID=239 RepID=UPI00260ED3A8|nr:response regulator [Flavobacterium sp.]
MLSKILCVDDDPITLMLCKKVISKAEFSNEIDTAPNGEKALLYLENIIEEKNDDTQFPELIFLDLNMPVMNGWEFLDIFSTDKYSKVFKNTKVIVLSSTIDPKDIEKSKSYPMVINFLSKPITLEILKSIEIK